MQLPALTPQGSAVTALHPRSLGCSCGFGPTFSSSPPAIPAGLWGRGRVWGGRRKTDRQGQNYNSQRAARASRSSTGGAHWAAARSQSAGSLLRGP